MPRFKRYQLVFMLISLSWGFAQTVQLGLPTAAQEALAKGQVAVDRALSSYDSNFPDQPFWQAAIDYGLEAKRLAPNRPEPLRFLAEVYTTTHWYSRAWQAWSDFQRVGGSFDPAARQAVAEVGSHLGYASYQAGKLDDALYYYRIVHQMMPADLDITLWLARIHSERGEAEEALPYWREAARQGATIAGRPASDYVARTERQLTYGVAASEAYNLGVAAAAAGRLEEALSAFETAIRDHPDFKAALIAAAEVSQQLGRTDEALRYWEAALAADPADTEVAAALERARQQVEPAGSTRAEVEVDAETQEVEQQAASQPSTPAPVSEVAQPTSSEPAEVETTETLEPRAPVSASTEVSPASNPAAAGEPRVLFDLNHRHDTVGSAFSFFSSPAWATGNLVAPVNYAGGTLYGRLEVLDKASDLPVEYQLCLVPPDISISPACSDASELRFTSPGVYEHSQPLPSFSQYGGVDWQRGVAQLMVIVRDGAGNPLSDAELAAYYPLTVHYTAVLVPAGGQFSGWP